MNARQRSKRQIGELTQAKLRELLSYDPETGEFRWLVRPSRNVREGDVAGNDGGQGYLRIAICGHTYRAHRLAWLYVHGAWPKGILDHINGRRADNRIANLREATHLLNSFNIARSAKNALGVVGVDRWGRKYRACITFAGKVHRLGLFPTLDEASAAYQTARQRFAQEVFK